MWKNVKDFFLFLILFFILIMPVWAESGIFDRIGMIPEHGFHGAVPEENIDLFTGNLTLRFKDIVLPGPNGFDLVVRRVYNSKIYRDDFASPDNTMQQDPYSWVGLGWMMHMGRVHNYYSDEPSIEFPDGRWETAYPTGTDHITKNFSKYDTLNSKLYFKDGSTWTFGASAFINGSSVKLVTEIENPYGYKIQVFYRQQTPILEKIIDSMNREVLFYTDDSMPADPRLKEIKVKNSSGQLVTYRYNVDQFPVTGCYRLASYDPPVISASEYFYNEYNDAGKYTLSQINTPFGGTMQYEYDPHKFYFYGYGLYTHVVTSKKIKFSPTDTYKTWSYKYPDYQTGDDIVVVNGPDFDTRAEYHGYPEGSAYENAWKIGLLKKKWFTEKNSSTEIYSEEMEWTYEQISNEPWTVLDQHFGEIKATLVESVTKIREGDAESREEYFYDPGYKEYGLLTKIKYYGGASGTTYKNYKTLDYYFKNNTIFADKYMISQVGNETVYSSSGTKLKETQTTYYTETGKCGAIKKIRRWKSGSTYLDWDYTYSGYNPNDITITINLPGSAGTETYEYSYGVLSELIRPGYTELTRSISQYNSAIETETNQHGGLLRFTYDNLGRITLIDMPSGFNDITASWSTNYVAIAQGQSSLKKYWDGMGRDTGYEEFGDGITLYYRKELDAEGRVVKETKGSTNSTHKYLYDRNAVGAPTKITDPLGKITGISYSGDQKTVTDANSKQTVFYYEDLPGSVTKLKDPTLKYAEYTYDNIGRLTAAKYNNSRNRSYAYNGLDQVTSENHPETGLISYTYNSENNLQQKTWGGVPHTYTYNSSNQLKYLSSGDETITYAYDTKGRVTKISSNKDWFRDYFLFNAMGSITRERHKIPNLPVSEYKTLEYAYDTNNNLKSITYPGGRRVEYTNNSLNMPETLNFYDGSSTKSLISQAAYGINKQPVSLTIAGNSTVFAASYKATGYLWQTSLQKSGVYLYRTEYTYDNVGNITRIDDQTANNFDGNFGYDSLYRLTSASYTGGKIYNYTYDTYGNLLTAKENSATLFSRAYDTQNRFSSGYSYDSRGNITLSPTYEYTWDKQNRLTQIEKSSTQEITGTFSYNERGLRFKASRLATITVTNPIGGETWDKGSSQNITWSSTGEMADSVKILLFQGSVQVREITPSTPNSGSFAWIVPADLTTGQYAITVQTIDSAVTGDSNIFSIDDAPYIEVLSPNGGESWTQSTVQNITWNAHRIAGSVKITLWVGDQSIGTIAADIDAEAGSYSWIAGQLASGTA
ncbi:MAG: hypothetical protein KAW12_10690, partial [Candidatus Aminicenantes bacterium]|nr:hypothetical protein [Candidatus Aminicenantes bacterium]